MSEVLERLRRIAEIQGLSLEAWLWMLEQGGSASQAVHASTANLPLTLPAERVGPGEGPPKIEPRYEAGDIVGAGGMGTVRRVFDRSLGRSVVRKELAVPCSRSTRERFLDEARTTARLQHPGVVPVHDVGELSDGRLFYTMREIRGRTLGQVMKELTSVGVKDPVS